MHYVIYPDSLFLENLICNLLFLTFFKSLFFPAAKGKKILFAAVLTAVCNTLVSIVFFHCIWILQVGALFPASGLMVCFCLEMKEGRRILFLLYEMMLWTMVLGGGIQALGQWMTLKISQIIFMVFFGCLIFGILEKIVRIYKRQNECMREVVLYWKGRSCHIKGFADTGNQLVDPISKKPVSIITCEAWHTLLEEDIPYYRMIPYKSVGNPGGLLQGVEIYCMAILEGKNTQVVEKPMIAITEQPFSGIFHYSILLHNDYC